MSVNIAMDIFNIKHGILQGARLKAETGIAFLNSIPAPHTVVGVLRGNVRMLMSGNLAEILASKK